MKKLVPVAFILLTVALLGVKISQASALSEAAESQASQHTVVELTRQ